MAEKLFRRYNGGKVKKKKIGIIAKRNKQKKGREKLKKEKK